MRSKPPLEFLESLDPNARAIVGKMKAKFPYMTDALLNHLYGDTYQRDEINLRERFLVTIAAIVASGDMAPQLAYQAELAMRNGVKREELMEVAYQISAFTGFGSAINSMGVIDRVADNMEKISKKTPVLIS